MFNLACHLHSFIKQIALLETGNRKLIIWLGQAKVSEKAIEVSLVWMVRIPLKSHTSETVTYISTDLFHLLVCCFPLRVADSFLEGWAREISTVWYWCNLIWKIRIGNYRCIFVTSTFGVHHAEVTVAWVISGFTPNLRNGKFQGFSFPSKPSCKHKRITLLIF